MSAELTTSTQSDVGPVPSMDRTSAFSPSSLYSFALLALCALTFALSLENGHHQSWDWWLLAEAIIGAALIASSEYSVIRLPFKWGSATVSVGATCGLGISIWLGPGFGIVLIGATLLIANWRRWHQVALSVENASSAALAGGLAGTVWWWMVPSGQDPLTSFKTTGVFILAALIHVAVNFGTVVIGTSIARREPIQAVARTMAGGWNFLFTIPVLAALIPLIGNQSLLGLLLFAAPLAFLHFALNALWQLRKEAQDTLAALTDLLELRDPYTAFHSERVTDYAMIIAASLPGFTPEEREVLERASRIHDIGKVAVTDAILLKAGALTPEERTKMESHASVGARLIENMNVYHDCVDLIRHHHERWDGRGYPGKLSSETIPLGARIMAVADSLDAMTTDRPYRKAMSFHAAIEEIQRNSGTQFDPQIVEAFLASLDDPLFQQMHERDIQTLAAD